MPNRGAVVEVADVNTKVVIVPCEWTEKRFQTVLARKRNMIWSNRARNRLVVEIATGLVTDPVRQLRKHGLSVAGTIFADRIEPEVLVLVDSVDHAETLGAALPGWPVLHLRPPKAHSEFGVHVTEDENLPLACPDLAPGAADEAISDEDPAFGPTAEEGRESIYKHPEFGPFGPEPEEQPDECPEFGPTPVEKTETVGSGRIATLMYTAMHKVTANVVIRATGGTGGLDWKCIRNWGGGLPEVLFDFEDTGRGATAKDGEIRRAEYRRDGLHFRKKTGK